MHKLIIVIAAIVSNSCYGQDKLRITSRVFAKEQLISRILANPHFITNKILTDKYSADSIDFGVMIYADIFDNESGNGLISLERPYYRIAAYAIDDTIFFKEINEIKYDQNAPLQKPGITPLLTVIDTPRTLRFIEMHNQKYQSAYTLKDFLNPSSTYGSFGFICGGYIASVKEEAHSLAKLVEEADLAGLKKLASSFSAHDRAFGTAGLYFAELRGIKLPEDLQRLVKLNRSSDLKISYCGGCIVGAKRLVELLDDSNLRSMYRTLIDHKILED